MTGAPAPQMIPLERLMRAEWNANRVPAATLEKVRRSIEEFGLVENLVARRHPSRRGKFEVLSGNHRLEILGELGFAEAPVVVVELGDADARILAQTLNRTRGQEDDPVAYAALLDVVLTQVGVGRALEFLPESESSIDRVLRAFGPAPAVDPDEAPSVPAEPVSVPGEVYELGQHRLLCGDARDSGAVAALVGACRPELLWSDPPYGVNYVGRTQRALRMANDERRGLDELLDGAFAAAAGVLAESARFYVAAPPGPRGLIFPAVRRAGRLALAPGARLGEGRS